MTLKIIHDWKDLPEEARGAAVALGKIGRAHV
jgi:hypothetical protein